MKEFLVEWNPWWEKHAPFSGVKRDRLHDVIPWVSRREMVAVVGARRAGKTTLLFEIIDYLICELKVNPRNILFIKGDDDRVEKTGLIDRALNEYAQLVNPFGNIFVLIDEIQEIEEWSKTLKRIYDLRTDIKLFISGSNADILKEELGVLLAGRFASFELFPFSFTEFLRAREVNINTALSIVQNKAKILHCLNEYLTYGSFPEVVLEKDVKLKVQLTQFYFDSIFYRDIVRRKKIRNPAQLEKMVKYFLQNISALANFAKVGDAIGLATDSIGEYVRAAEEAYLIFSVNLFAFSYRKQIVNPKKMYCVDAGIRNGIGFTFSEDAGKIYENTVFVHLRQSRNEIFYWAGKHECDFIVKNGKKLAAIQVCYDIRNAKEREQKGLLEALNNFKLKEGTIITHDYEDEEEIEGKIIHYIPLWKWLLQKKSEKQK